MREQAKTGQDIEKKGDFSLSRGITGHIVTLW